MGDDFQQWVSDLHSTLTSEYNWPVLLVAACTNSRGDAALYRQGKSPEEAAKAYVEFGYKPAA